MANTYTQIFYHVVFAVKGRANLISSIWKDELYKYISGIVTNQGQKLYIVNGMPDHIHILVSCKPNMNLSNFVKEIKEHSSKYINENGFIQGKFNWQEGFGAFSVSFKNVEQVVNYIKNQEKHHEVKSFKDEYLEFLKEQNIDFEEKYIFEEVK
jgi:REP element-mobilizing transposase RayT